MDNYTYLKSLSLEDMGHFLCYNTESQTKDEFYPCEICPMNDKCQAGSNGWITWLREEKK